MKNKLKNIANHLLDLGKRNRLLNFKDSGYRTLSILNKDLEFLFQSITNSKVFSVFMLDEVLLKYHNDLAFSSDKDNVLEYSPAKVYEIAGNIVKKNQVLCYKKGVSLEKVLKALYREYKFSITEKGINSFYLSFGFIRYVEDKETYDAPLLLIPIEFTVEQGIYKIKEYEDEILLNPTLKYYFKTEQNISLPDYTDESLEEYFEKIEKELNKDTFLIKGCALGIYSFLKMNMYNDIITNTDLVLQNENIQTLLGNPKTSYPPLEDKPVYPVVNCDSSQLEAIRFAVNGQSFVLQGPPGSGKSQTITNMISSLIAEGKHVLFVSEKLAALNVVYENLKRAGLSDFAIELHSNKANKKEFIENLYKTALLPKYDIDIKTEQIHTRYKFLKSNIENYYKELHEKRESYGLSLYELISLYSEIEIESIPYPIKNIEKYTLKDMERIFEELNQYAFYANPLGYDYKDMPFYGLLPVSNEYIRYEFDTEVKDAISYLKKLIQIKNKLNENLNLQIVNLQELLNRLDIVDALVHLKTYHPTYLIKKSRNELVEWIEKYNEFQNKLDKTALKNYKKEILKEDLEQLFIDFNSGYKGIFRIFHSSYKQAKRTILGYRKSKIGNKKLRKEIEELTEYKKNLMASVNYHKKIKNILQTKDAIDLKTILTDLKSLNNEKDIFLEKEKYEDLKPYLTDILITFHHLDQNMDNLKRLFSRFDGNIFNGFEVSMDSVLAKCKSIYLKKDRMEEYHLLAKSIEKLKEYHMQELLDTFLKQGIELSMFALQFKKLFLQSVLYQMIDESPLLGSFTGYNEDKIVEDFASLDEEMLNIHRDYIISYNSKKRPDDVLLDGTEFRILVSEANKLRRQKPIRSVLEQIFELALDIKPVFLMSPLSVSTYLSNQNDLFDCVIFDEASQIFAWDALGAIYRAKQCIIIGDTKQMPPSNFFGAMTYEEVLEMDSILDVASLYFKTTRLKWHYRSRSEELITFSNHKFYDSGLITIPQAKKHEKGFGIDFYYLKDGIYDVKTRTNLVEANYICDMVFEHFQTSSLSLGVVAFSDVQARLIEDLIEKRLSDCPEYAKYFDETAYEPFFVKNLESVQGDERDRIIFSICYGYNADNKFYQRFGPLNNLGGERRLNVAITRAKYNISVVSSIRYTDIRLENTESLGVQMLRDYLEYIEQIEHSEHHTETQEGILKDIKRYLEDMEYTCFSNYGSSAFVIDLAVFKGDCKTAIMLDKTNSFHMNTTDKQRLERLLLERQGWKYYRLYSVAWVKQNTLEKERLKNGLEENNEKEDNDKTEENYLCKEDKISSLEEKFDRYLEYSPVLAKEVMRKNGLSDMIKEFVRVEQPIHEDYLFKKVANILETRVTQVLKNRVRNSIQEDIYKDGSYYLIESKEEYRLRLDSDRTLEQIYPEELKQGILMIVEGNNGITIEGCYKALIRLLGITRLTENTRKVLDDMVVYLKLEGKLTQRGESLFV